MRTPILPFSILLLAAAPAAAQEFAVQQLDADGVVDGWIARSIDEAGDVAGTGIEPATGLKVPTTWQLDGTSTVLPLLPGDEEGEAYDVGPTGIVAGVSVDVVAIRDQLRFTMHPMIWIDGYPLEVQSIMTSGATYLDALEVRASNKDGDVLGWGRHAAQLSARGFVLELTGQVTDIGSVLGPGIGNSRPFDMNDRGVVVGDSKSGAGTEHAFVWQDGVMTDLHDPSWGFSSNAYAINEAGVVVGAADWSNDGLQYLTATRWVDGVPESLGLLASGAHHLESFAHGVNEHGWIVGVATLPIGSFSNNAAFLWRDGQMIDLNTLIDPQSGWYLFNALDVDDHGRIVGKGLFGGSHRPYALVPNCKGGFDVYGTGCAGTDGYTTRLAGAGCPSGGSPVWFSAVNGRPGELSALMFGRGDASVTVFPGCVLQILPTIPLSISMAFDGPAGVGGAGTWTWRPDWPRNLPPLFAQVWSFDPGAPNGITASNAIEIRP